jgi:hypothetical protein
MDLKLASITGAGVNLAYLKTSAESSPRGLGDRCCEFGHRCIVWRRRPFSEWPTKQAFKKRFAHLCRP